MSRAGRRRQAPAVAARLVPPRRGRGRVAAARRAAVRPAKLAAPGTLAERRSRDRWPGRGSARQPAPFLLRVAGCCSRPGNAETVQGNVTWKLKKKKQRISYSACLWVWFVC